MTTEELAAEFEAFRGQLQSFILRMTASVQDAEDIVQETYLKALAKIDSFRGDSSLKTWVFAIAANLARDLLRSKKRWPENVTDICKDAALGDPDFLREAMDIRQTSPQGVFEIREHISFCFTCVSKSLPLEQQLVLLLKEVYGFKMKEIGQIIDRSEGMIKYYLRLGRSKMMAIFDHRCALINKQGVCHQCTELNGIFNPEQKEQEALVGVKMVQAAGDASKETLFDLRLLILRDLDPFTSGGAELQLHHMEHNRRVMERHLNDKP